VRARCRVRTRRSGGVTRRGRRRPPPRSEPARRTSAGPHRSRRGSTPAGAHAVRRCASRDRKFHRNRAWSSEIASGGPAASVYRTLARDSNGSCGAVQHPGRRRRRRRRGALGAGKAVLLEMRCISPARLEAMILLSDCQQSYASGLLPPMRQTPGRRAALSRAARVLARGAVQSCVHAVAALARSVWFLSLDTRCNAPPTSPQLNPLVRAEYERECSRIRGGCGVCWSAKVTLAQ